MGAENSVYYLTQVEGIDAIAFGHSHSVFPSKEFANLPGADIEKGTINGIPAVPGRWGDHVGIMDLVLDKENSWKVTSAQTEARPIFDKATQKPIDADQLVAAVKVDHNATRDFVNQPIGKASDVMYSYLALVQDDPTVQIVNLAQKIMLNALFKVIPISMVFQYFQLPHHLKLAVVVTMQPTLLKLNQVN